MSIILSANTTQFISDLPLPSGTTFSSGTTELLAPVGDFTTEDLRASASLQAKIDSGDITLYTEGSIVVSANTIGINYFTTYGGNFNGPINVDGIISSGGTDLANIFTVDGDPIISACTTVFTNKIESCSGNTEILLTSGSTVINTDLNPTIDNTLSIGTPLKRFRNINTVSGTTSYWSATTIVHTPILHLGIDSSGNTRQITANNSIIQNDCLLGGTY